MASRNDYAPPLDQLLLIGEADLGGEWRDYRAIGIGPEHVPELVRMATDADLVLSADEEDADEASSWAPEHALRALGQLGAVEAAGPLLDGLSRFIDIHDVSVEDLGDVLAVLGPGVLPACEAYLADDDHPEYARIVVSEAYPKIVEAHPEHRGAGVGSLTAQLGRHVPGNAALNGFIVSALLDLKAVESAPAIEAAFEARCIDETIAGGWPDVRFDLGLGPKPESRRRVERRIAEMNRGRSTGQGRPDLKKLKQQKKRQKQGRKQQRRRKK